MKIVEMNVTHEAELEEFLSTLKDTLDSREETELVVTMPHAEWANIILDNIETDDAYQLPEGVDPFIDVRFVYPDCDVTDANLDDLSSLLEELRDLLDEGNEGDPND